MKRPKLATVTGATAITVAIFIWVALVLMIVLMFYMMGTAKQIPHSDILLHPELMRVDPQGYMMGSLAELSGFMLWVAVILLVIICAYLCPIAFVFFFAGINILKGRAAGRRLFNIGAFFLVLTAYAIIKSKFSKDMSLGVIWPFLVILAYCVVGVIFVYLPKSQAYFMHHQKNQTVKSNEVAK